MQQTAINFLVLVLLTSQLISSSYTKWNLLYYDSYGCLSQIIPSTLPDGEKIIYSLSCQGEVAHLALSDGTSKTLHALKDSNFFSEAGLTLAYVPANDLLLISADINANNYGTVWTSDTTDTTKDNYWTLRSTSTLVSTYSAFLPYSSNTNLQVAAGKTNGKFVLYDIFTKSEPYSFVTTTTCGKVQSIAMLERVVSGVSYIDYLTFHASGCLYYYPTSTSTPGTMGTAFLVSAASTFDNLKYVFYRTATNLYLIYSGSVTTAPVTINIYNVNTAAVSTSFTIAGTVQVNDLVIAQATETQDVLVIATSKGEIYTYSLTDFINGLSPSKVLITTTIAPFLTASSVLSIYASPVASSNSVRYVLMCLRDNGLVQQYDFSQQSWSVLGSAGDWIRGTATTFSRFLTIYDVDDDGFGELVLNYNGGIYIMYNDVHQSFSFTRFEPSVNNEVVSKMASDSRTSSSFSAYSGGYRNGLSITTLNNALSWLQVMAYIDQGFTMSVLLSDGASTPTTLTLIIEGYETNTQATRCDWNHVKIVLNSGTSSSQHLSIRYTDLWSYSYLTKTLSWRQTTPIVV